MTGRNRFLTSRAIAKQVATAALFLKAVTIPVFGQDRFPETDDDFIYPDKMLIQNGGSIIDVTDIPDFISEHNAYPDGSHPEETTQALIDCYDYLLYGASASVTWGANDNVGIIYFPNGEYLINNTIVYSGPVRLRESGHEAITRIRFRGQNRENVTIRLMDHAPGFDSESAPKEVISFGKHNRNNSVSTNFFENITINTGNGNPGAIALKFHGANNEDIRNVTIMSEDGSGYIGLNLPMGACQGYYVDITVDGFDYGIHASNELATSLSLEFITLKNQNIAGIWTEDVSISVRKLFSQNTVPAVLLTHQNGLLNIIDSELTGGNTNNTAIDIRDTGNGLGYLFARNIKIEGYGNGVSRNGKIKVNGNIDEYVTGKVYSLFEGSNKRSLNLPVEVTPFIPWEPDFSNWAIVNDYGADAQDEKPDSEAIQRAMNAGKSQVFFQAGQYVLDKPVYVPAHVERINFMYSKFWVDGNVEGMSSIFKDSDQGAFTVNEDAHQPLIIEDLRSEFEFFGEHWFIDHASKRTLIMSDLHMQRGQMYKNTVAGGKVYIENCTPRSGRHGTEGLVPFKFSGQEAWIRYLNPEHSSLEVLIDSSKVWLFGFKKEGWGTAFKVINDSEFEMIGGFGSTWGWEGGIEAGIEVEEYPLVVIEDSKASVSAVTLGNDSEYYKTIVQDSQKGVMKTLLKKDLPHKDNGHILLPLYSNLGNE